MGEINPLEPRVNNPELEADLIRLLSITGPLGTIRVADVVLPTVSLGSVVTETVTVLQPSFRSTDVFSAGPQQGIAVPFVHADTGPLAEGAYDLQLHISDSFDTGQIWDVQHRNAANAANLAIWSTVLLANSGTVFNQQFAYEFAGNERLRILNRNAFVVGEISNAFIFARRRT